jgi:hypothetical protein
MAVGPTMTRKRERDKDSLLRASEALTVPRSNELLEKALVNLRVIGQLQEGDRLGFTANGFFLLQRPTSRFAVALNSLSRIVSRTSRWETLARVNELVGNAELFYSREDRERIEEAVREALPGMRALQRTYAEDALFCQNICVLSDRVHRRFGIKND